MRTPTLLLTLVCLAGCVGPPAVLGPPVGPPGPALAIAPIRLAYVPTDEVPVVRTGDSIELFHRMICLECEEEQEPMRTCPACRDCGAEEFEHKFSKPFRPKLDPDGLRSRVVETLTARGTFTRVGALPEPEGELEQPARTQALLEAARAEGLEWLLELAVEDAKTEFVKKNAFHGWKIAVLIVSSILIFPAVDPLNWFLPGEDYAVRVRGRWTIKEVSSGSELGNGSFDAERRDSFAAFGLGVPSRSFFVLGFMRTPGCLDEDDWREIAEQLHEGAIGDTIRAVVTQVEGERPEASPAPE